MTEQIGDILDVKCGIICHQVNCRRVAGAGLAKQIRDKWPEWYRYFRTMSRCYESLGEFSVYTLEYGNLYIASLYAQENYGGRLVKHTDYEAFGKCLIELAEFVKTLPELSALPIYFPFKVGCGLANGSWVIIEPLIEKYFPNATIMRREND